MTMILGILAGLLHVLAFVIYKKQISDGTSSPNTATWTLWVFLTLLNCASYFSISMDWVKSILPILSSLACIVTFCSALSNGKFSALEKYDSIALVFGIISALVWYIFQSASWANVILQLGVVVSFIPTYRGLIKDPFKEKSLPWFVWSSAYVLSLIVIILRWQQWQEVVYPIGGFILHFGVGLLAKSK